VELTELMHQPVIVTLVIMNKIKFVTLVLINVSNVLPRPTVKSVLMPITELPQFVTVLVVGLMLVLNNVTLVLHNVLPVSLHLITVPPVNQVENNQSQNVHVQVDKLKSKEPVTLVITNVLNVPELFQTVAFVLLIEFIIQNVFAQMVISMMVTPPPVKSVEISVLPVKMVMDV